VTTSAKKINHPIVHQRKATAGSLLASVVASKKQGPKPAGKGGHGGLKKSTIR
jgi:hypothetical protein